MVAKIETQVQHMPFLRRRKSDRQFRSEGRFPRCNKDPQTFPWDGREEFVYEVIPQLVGLKPWEHLDFYRVAAYYASRPWNMLQQFLAHKNMDAANKTRGLFNKHIQTFSETDEIRVREIRQFLYDKNIIHGDFVNGNIHLLDMEKGKIVDPTRRALLELALEAVAYDEDEWMRESREKVINWRFYPMPAVANSKTTALEGADASDKFCDGKYGDR